MRNFLTERDPDKIIKHGLIPFGRKHIKRSINIVFYIFDCFCRFKSWMKISMIRIEPLVPKIVEVVNNNSGRAKAIVQYFII